MRYATLGTTDISVSRIALGCMSYGNALTGIHAWTLDEDAAQPFFRQAVELGINFWDTANVYQGGSSEEFVGRAIRRYSTRDQIVLATKVWGRMHDGPTGAGLSRAAIMEQIDASLTRLCTDYVDLYIIHRFDPTVPVEETMEALHDVVQAGKARAIGASSMWAWQFAKMQHAADLHGWTRFVSMQDQYNLIKREEEREMLPMCTDMGVSSTPYSPLGKGRLTRPWGEQTDRSAQDTVAKAFDLDSDAAVVDALHTLSVARGIPMAQLAMAWVLSKPAVASCLVGATKAHHLADAAAAVELVLTPDEVAALEAPYVTQPAFWW